MIYFVQPVEGGPVKIGFSEDFPTRLYHLERHYGKELVVLATRPGGRAEERAMHERFAHLRFGRTEQFRPEPDLMGFIGRPLMCNRDLQTVPALRPINDDVIVKIDRQVMAKAGYVARQRRMSMAKYVGDIVREVVEKDFRDEYNRAMGNP